MATMAKGRTDTYNPNTQEELEPFESHLSRIQINTGYGSENYGVRLCLKKRKKKQNNVKIGTITSEEIQVDTEHNKSATSETKKKEIKNWH